MGKYKLMLLYCSSHIPCFLNFLFFLFPHPARIILTMTALLSDSPDEGPLILQENGHQYYVAGGVKGIL